MDSCIEEAIISNLIAYGLVDTKIDDEDLTLLIITIKPKPIKYIKLNISIDD